MVPSDSSPPVEGAAKARKPASVKRKKDDATRKGEAKNGTLRKDAANKDAAKKGAPKKDAAKKDAVKKDAVKKDAVKKDAVKKDAANKIAAKKAARKKRATKEASDGGVRLPTKEGVTRLGAPWLVEFRGDTVTVHDVSDGPREVRFTVQDLDAGDDLLLVTDLHVPELTEKERTSDDAYQRACRKLNARVEGELIRRGGASLHWASHSGSEDRDWLVYWSLSGAESKTGHRTPPGAYPMTLSLGDQTVARFVVHWS